MMPLAHRPRGFIAVLPVLMISVSLVGLAAAINETTYHTRYLVNRAEQERAASALARACGKSVLIRLMNGETVAPERVGLGEGVQCQVLATGIAPDYWVRTSVTIRSMQTDWHTEARVQDGLILYTVSSEI